MTTELGLLEKIAFKILTQAVSVWHKRPLKEPSPQEREQIAALRENISGRSAPKGAWGEHVQELIRHVNTEDPRRFLDWDVVQETMFVSNDYYIRKELDYLKEHRYWKERWREGIREKDAGHPLPSIFYPKSSGNLIHHAYHLCQFEDKTGEKITDHHFVFEFGGGYGSMCNLLYQIGFHGKYAIFDFPPFSALQVFYLKLLGLNAVFGKATGDGEKRIHCLYEIDSLERILKEEVSQEKKSTFIATWSMSEAPLEMRQKILNGLGAFDSFLIGYQRRFEGIDNVRFFTDWRKKMDHVEWKEWEIDHLPGNFYLVGKKRR